MKDVVDESLDKWFAPYIDQRDLRGLMRRTEAVFWLTPLNFIEGPVYRRYSHAGHHSHTWFKGLDPQKPYGNPLPLRRYIAATLDPLFYAVNDLGGRTMSAERRACRETVANWFNCAPTLR